MMKLRTRCADFPRQTCNHVRIFSGPLGTRIWKNQNETGESQSATLVTACLLADRTACWLSRGYVNKHARNRSNFSNIITRKNKGSKWPPLRAVQAGETISPHRKPYGHISASCHCHPLSIYQRVGPKLPAAETLPLRITPGQRCAGCPRPAMLGQPSDRFIQSSRF